MKTLTETPHLALAAVAVGAGSQTLMRGVNDDVRRVILRRGEAEPIPFCDCPDARCYQLLWLKLDEYDRLAAGAGLETAPGTRARPQCASHLPPTS